MKKKYARFFLKQFMSMHQESTKDIIDIYRLHYIMIYIVDIYDVLDAL